MAAFCSREWWSDARHYQIAALATLLVYNVFWVDFGAQPLNSLLAIGGALATQALCTYLFALPEFDPRSPLITGLIALVAFSPLVLLIDRIFPAERFVWSRPAIYGA